MSKLERWLPFKFRRKKAAAAQDSKPPSSEGRAEPLAIQTSQPPPAGRVGAMTPMSSLVGSMLDSFYSDPFFASPLTRMTEIGRWFGDFAPTSFQPTVDIVDEETALRISAELPGMSKEDVKLHIDGDMLVLRGEKRNVDERSENGVYRTERFYGAFRRAVPLPPDIDREHAEAAFDNGVLTVRFPKLPAAPSNRRLIAVR